MKYLLSLIMVGLLITPAAFARPRTMLGIGYRFDTSNSNYSNSYNNQRNDCVVLTGKVFLFESHMSQWSTLFLAPGVNYQLDKAKNIDFSLSPIAFRNPEGATFSFDLYKKGAKGGWAGFSVGFSF